MAEEYESEWDLGSGNYTDYTGTVIGSWFKRNENNGNMELVWKMETDDPAVPEWTENYGCGAGWESNDEGVTIEHVEGKTRLHPRSTYGKLIKALQKVAPGVATWGSPRDSRIHLGATYKMQETTETFKRDGEEVEFSRNYPVEFMGKAATDGQPPSSGSGITASSTTASLDDYSEALAMAPVDKMRELAMVHPHSAWIDHVLELPGVAEDAKLTSILAEPGLYKAMKG